VKLWKLERVRPSVVRRRVRRRLGRGRCLRLEWLTADTGITRRCVLYIATALLTRRYVTFPAVKSRDVTWRHCDVTALSSIRLMQIAEGRMAFQLLVTRAYDNDACEWRFSRGVQTEIKPASDVDRSAYWLWHYLGL